MKKNIIIALFLCLIIAIASSCHKCDNCQHGGTCDGKGGCSCNDPYSGRNCDTLCALGYEGYHCATFSREKFIGTWDCTSKDPLGNSQSFQMSFTPNAAQPVYVYLSNFNDKGYKMSCTMSGQTKFDINAQIATNASGTLHTTVSGYAIMRSGKLTLYITEDGVDYFATATKQ